MENKAEQEAKEKLRTLAMLHQAYCGIDYPTALTTVMGSSTAELERMAGTFLYNNRCTCGLPTCGAIKINSIEEGINLARAETGIAAN
jgi:hypothetical protein